MGDRGIDSVMISLGADLPYLTGYEAMPSERLTMLAVPGEGEATMVVPLLEAPRVPPGPFDIITWSDGEDPLRIVAGVTGQAKRVALGDHTWSVFLLGLQEAMPGVRWEPLSPLTSELRMRKDEAELAALRSAASAVDRVLGRVAEIPFAGRSERVIARDLAALTVAEGHQVSSFAIVGSGPNGASPHHEPEDRLVSPGELVVCDFGGRLDGYFSDVTRTFSVGEPTNEQVDVHSVVLEANRAGRAAVAPGVACEEVDRAARKVVVAAGYGDSFIHRTGHGIGLEVHEHPYLVEGNRRLLEAGMTFSVEPGIYLPGRFGVRIEDIVACRGSGGEELNRADRGLVVVG